MQHASVVSSRMINTIRRLSFAISPHMLDDLGLNATLEWHCREFSILNGIPCEFESGYDESALSREIKIDFFRICQESLANVTHHAQASRVKVSIVDAEGKIILRITDNGKGFDIGQQKNTPGLIAMRERATSINGRLAVQSEPGKGTRICVEVVK